MLAPLWSEGHLAHPHLHSFPTRRSSDLNRRRHCGTATTTALLGTSATHPFSQTPRLSDQNRHRSTLGLDRKSTRLNSSHVAISYAVFCLKKKIIHGHLTAAMYEAPEDII